MRNKWIKRLFPIFVILTLAPWPVAYAYAYEDDPGGQNGIRIEAAEASAQPVLAVYGETVGGATPGDLFYIDATDNPVDMTVTLYITNAGELVDFYQYLILEVGILAESDAGEWERACMGNGEPVPEGILQVCIKCVPHGDTLKNNGLPPIGGSLPGAGGVGIGQVHGNHIQSRPLCGHAAGGKVYRSYQIHIHYLLPASMAVRRPSNFFESSLA